MTTDPTIAAAMSRPPATSTGSDHPTDAPPVTFDQMIAVCGGMLSGTPMSTGYGRLRLFQQLMTGEVPAATEEFCSLLRAMWPDAACLVLYYTPKTKQLAPDYLTTADGTTLYSFDHWNEALPQAPEHSATFASTNSIVTVQDLAAALRVLHDAGLEVDEYDLDPDPYDPTPCLRLSPDDTDSVTAGS